MNNNPQPKRARGKIIATSQTELAMRLGCSQPSICRWMSLPGWRWGGGPWTRHDAEQILAWRALHDRTADPIIRRARMKLMHAQLQALDLDITIAEGDLVPREEVELILLRAMLNVRANLKDIGFRNEDAIIGRPVEEIEDVLAESIKQIERQYAREIRQAESVAAVGRSGVDTVQETFGGCPTEAGEKAPGIAPAPAGRFNPTNHGEDGD